MLIIIASMFLNTVNAGNLVVTPGPSNKGTTRVEGIEEVKHEPNVTLDCGYEYRFSYDKKKPGWIYVKALTKGAVGVWVKLEERNAE